MTQAIKLSIPASCSQKWENFKQTDAGGFCNSCNKTVVDFTQMTDEEIVGWFSQGRGNTCGRFHPHQLKTYRAVAIPRIYPGLSLFRTGLVVMLLTLISKAGYSGLSYSPAATQISVDNATLKFGDYQSSRQVARGVVVDVYDNTPIPGVNVAVKGTNKSTITDVDGRFEILNVEEGDVITFSFIGYRTQELIVGNVSGGIQINMDIDVVLEIDVVFLGQVLVEPAHSSSTIRSFWSRLFGHSNRNH